MHFDNANLLGAVGQWKEFGVETAVGRKQGAQRPPLLPPPHPPTASSPGQEMRFFSEKHASSLQANQLLNRLAYLHSQK